MRADTGHWLERFFDGDNGLRWSALQDPTHPWSPQLLPWIALAKADDRDLPIILPRLEADDRPSWYCAGRSARGALRLHEALQAFIGPSYSDFDGRPYPLNADDPVEAAFAEDTVAPAYRIRASTPGDVRRIQRALELYCGLLERMPEQVRHGRRPLGALRAELDRAVAAGDEAEAGRLLEKIRGIGRLDAENLLYVHVGVRAGLGQWRELAEDGALLNQLIGLRLPPRVLADIHDALYRRYVEPSEDADAPEYALAAFRAAGLARRSTLFGSRRGLRGARVLKAFFLYELAREDQASTGLADLADELEGLDDTFAHALATLGRPTEASPPADPMDVADAAFDDLEIDRALDLYVQAPPSRKRLSRLIRCAEDVGTAEATKRVIDAIQPGDDAGNLPPSWAARLQALLEKCTADEDTRAPKGWLEWARRVEAGMGEDEAMSALREHMATWDPAELSGSKVQADELTGIINNASASAEPVFREAAPLLYQALIPESGAPPRRVKPLLQILVTKVAFLADPSQTELELARDMASTLLLIGLDAKEYEDLITDLEDLMGTQMSVFTLGWSLDLAELFAINPCPDPERRLRLVLRVTEAVRRLAHRLSPADAMVIEQLCRDYGIDCPAEIGQVETGRIDGAADALSGKSVGIYTLVEPAGQRAAALLYQICPTVRVELNSDHECTKALSHLARSADLFVFAWKSSKHQAFYCVKDHRDANNPMIQAQGKGTSSILRALLEFV
ncbi:MAG: hypothetical protein AW08_03258 [Candidatus Accumulibacter adjunctus]|uniref:Uncharacterized protein n=1 Tax=Candidatus Accumulibacter adjunctus TaxID=1454001 RepID=A0A011PGF2_9PROT|nr:MAG: hypothetical protein AW08_03258 [Candidatus Accumulibacter adjunctus]